jgi:antitoxin PrlF
MPVSRITSRYRITLPPAVRRALGLKPGDRLVWRIEDGSTAILRPRPSTADPFATFTEWDSAADRTAYDRL